MKRRVCVITGSRAEYGLLRWVMKGLRSSHSLELQVIATGMHLSELHGNTYREICEDGFAIDRMVDLHLVGDSSTQVAQSVAFGVSGIAQALDELKPDLTLLLGDRFEILAAASAATICRIPIAHLHGGETTEGAFDESIRHAVTKMSHLHFVAAEEYRKRVIQLGEDPTRVYLVGGLGVDSIHRVVLMGKAELEQSLGFKFLPRNLLVTYHPTTLQVDAAFSQTQELLAALETLENTGLIFTLPNADPGGIEVGRQIIDFAKHHRNACVYPSLGQVRYFSCIRQVDGVIGNSSSGLLEVPSFAKGTINIGGRQRGRLKADSVIDCLPDRREILKAIGILYSKAFQLRLTCTVSPYGISGTSDKIVRILETVPFNNLLEKTFHEI